MQKSVTISCGRARAVRNFLAVDVRNGLDADGLRGTVRLLQERTADPLPYTPEQPENADQCICGSRRSSHFAVPGRSSIAAEVYDCQEFRLAEPTPAEAEFQAETG